MHDRCDIKEWNQRCAIHNNIYAIADDKLRIERGVHIAEPQPGDYFIGMREFQCAHCDAIYIKKHCVFLTEGVGAQAARIIAKHEVVA